MISAVQRSQNSSAAFATGQNWPYVLIARLHRKAAMIDQPLAGPSARFLDYRSAP